MLSILRDKVAFRAACEWLAASRREEKMVELQHWRGSQAIFDWKAAPVLEVC